MYRPGGLRDMLTMTGASGGTGMIGCKYASIFRGLRIKVNLINTRDKLLSFLDDEIIDALASPLASAGY